MTILVWIIIAVIILMFVVWGIICVADGEYAGSLVGFIPAIIIAAIVILSTHKCPDCGYITLDDDAYCKECGQVIENSYLIDRGSQCPVCKSNIDKHQKFCTHCGRDLR